MFLKQCGAIMHSIKDIDGIVGRNLFKFRHYRGYTQETLAKAVGVTFQQVQKYEKGTNRISVSRLWQFSKVLKISVDGFYEGIEGAVQNEVLRLTPEQLFLLKGYDGLSEAQKKTVLEYMQFLRSRFLLGNQCN